MDRLSQLLLISGLIASSSCRTHREEVKILEDSPTAPRKPDDPGKVSLSSTFTLKSIMRSSKAYETINLILYPPKEKGQATEYKSYVLGTAIPLTPNLAYKAEIRVFKGSSQVGDNKNCILEFRSDYGSTIKEGKLC